VVGTRPALHHGHGERAKGHELALGDEDHPGHGKNQHQRQGHQSIDGAVDNAVLPQQQGNLQIHIQLSFRGGSAGVCYIFNSYQRLFNKR
jgi:hypothetical protein